MGRELWTGIDADTVPGDRDCIPGKRRDGFDHVNQSVGATRPGVRGVREQVSSARAKRDDILGVADQRWIAHDHTVLGGRPVPAFGEAGRHNAKHHPVHSGRTENCGDQGN